MSAFNAFQESKMFQLQEELRHSRPDASGELQRKGVSLCGYALTEVDGVTVLIKPTGRSPRGGFVVPAVRTYHKDSLDAAVSASGDFAEQRSRDLDLDRRGLKDPREWERGHFGPVVKTDWSCNSLDCPCNDGEEIAWRRYRSLEIPKPMTRKAS